MSARRRIILKHFTDIILWGFLFLICVMLKNNVTLHRKYPVGEKLPSANNTNVLLKCEEIWNQVLKSRKRKFTSLIDPTQFLVNEFLEIVTSNKSICNGISENYKKSGGIRLAIVVVHSERSHFSERQFIRESWGSIREWDDWEIRTVFLLGQSDYCLKIRDGKEARENAKDEEQEISNEVEKFGDIVIGSFTDSLKNKTYKHLIGYKYVLESCPQATLIIKTEENIFINLPQVLQTTSENSYDILCERSKNLEPVRCSKCDKGKYFVTDEEWNSNRYPPYCQGSLLAVSKKWAEGLYGARGLPGFFWMDQVFVTGLLREAAEKEFGDEAKIYEINGMVKKRNDGSKWVKQLCKYVDNNNLEQKRKKLGIYEIVDGKWMGCLWSIMSGSNLPFSLM